MTNKKQKFGLFICKCRGEISNHVPTDKLAKVYKDDKDIAFIHVSNSLCDAIEMEVIQSNINHHKPDGIILAACSPRYYEQYFRTIASKSDLNAGKVTFANIREQIAWIYENRDSEFVLDKSKLAIEVAKSNLHNTAGFIATNIEIKNSVAIIGGGVGGIQTALSISRSRPETEIHIIERNSFIGGNQLKYSKAFPRDECSSCAMAPLISEVAMSDNITIHDKSEVIDCVGRVGDYRLKLREHARYVTDQCIACGKCADVCPQEIYINGVDQKKAIHIPFQGSLPNIYNINREDVAYCQSECSKPCIGECPTDAINLFQIEEESEMNVGVIVISTGAEVHDPIPGDNPYGFGAIPDVISLHQYEMLMAAGSRWNGGIHLLSDEKKSPESIAFILCVERSNLGYCSKYCCLSTAASIRQTVDKLSEVKIYVFYQDMFADSKYGDEYIRSTRRLPNVQWIRAMPRQIEQYNGKISLSVPVSGGNLELGVDMLVLATGMKPPHNTSYLRHIFGLDASKEGFFSEFDLLFSPVSTSDIGKFVVGTATGPKTIPETTISAYAAGSQIINLLNKKEINLPVSITEVSEDLCSGCGICVKTCPYHANTINLDKHIAETDITRCRGCGNCVVACPANARDLIEYSGASIKNAIDILGDGKRPENPDDPNMLAFLCKGCGYAAADSVGLAGGGMSYSHNLSIIRVPCSGRVDPRHMIHALTKFDGVLIGGCKLHSCQYSVGNFDAQKRVFLLQGTLEAANIDSKRLCMEYYSPTEAEEFAQTIGEFEETLRDGIIAAKSASRRYSK